MESRPPAPLPPRPDFDTPRPAGSWLGIALASSAGFTLAAILAFLTLGYFIPIVLLALGIFVIIGLQYLVWGWWFERIYRAQPEEEALPKSVPADHRWPKPPDIV